MKNYKNTILTIIFIGALIVGSGVWDMAEAADASVYVFPKEASKKIGDTFDVLVKVNPSGQKVCAVEGKLNLDKLTCQKITMGSDISSQTAPSCDDLNFLLGIQKCTTSKKTLFTITVKAKDAGSGTINFTGVDIIGEGVSLGSTSSSGNYTIATALPSCICGVWSFWQNNGCGEGQCVSTQQLQTRARTCAPSGCLSEKESKCVYDSTCVVSQKNENAEKKDILGAVDSGAELKADTEEPIKELEQTDSEIKTEEKELTELNMTEKNEDNIIDEKMPNESFLASIGSIKGITQSVWFIVMVVLCLVGLTGIGIRQWLLSQKKK